MSKQRQMEIYQAVLHAAHFLRGRGFSVLPAKRGARSRYLKSKTHPFKIRVSDHITIHPEKSPEVIRSIIIRAPMTAKEIERRCRKELDAYDLRVAKRLNLSRPTPSEDQKRDAP